jgi:DNA-binding transcriptional LysR family regulator
MVVAAVDAGSFSAAGRKLGIPLATVSRKVSDLERHLQTRLFTRATRSIALTEAGAAYVAVCRRVLQEITEAEEVAAGEYSAPKGDLLITAPLVFGRLHLLPPCGEVRSGPLPPGCQHRRGGHRCRRCGSGNSTRAVLPGRQGGRRR